MKRLRLIPRLLRVPKTPDMALPSLRHCVHAMKNGIARKDLSRARAEFFSKGQPCLRASPVTKRYGWGVHSDSQGRVAIFAVESREYARLAKDKTLKQLKAMRSKRA